jgi:hypothetical protein
MDNQEGTVRSLREIEEEVLTEGREWMRQRLAQKLQEEANRHGGVFPPESKQSAASAGAPDASADSGGSD